MYYAITALLMFCGAMYGYSLSLKHRIRYLKRDNERLNQNLQTLITEYENVKQAKSISENNRNLSDDDVDQFLQDGGYFRSE